MNEKPVDRRVRKTKRQLRLALMQLMSEKNVKDISVRELAAIADINRGTFYIHYKDVYDLLSQLEDEMAAGLSAVCQKHNPDEYDGNTFPYLSDLYHFIAENADMCRVLLGANGDKAYTDRICRILRDDHLYDFVSNFHKDADPTLIDYFCAFIISGNLSLALRWIATGMQETPDEMAILAGKIITQGVQVLSKEAGE